MQSLAVTDAAAIAVTHADRWDAVIAAWRAQVAMRTGSTRTPAEYEAYVRRFVFAYGFDPVTAHTMQVQAFAYGVHVFEGRPGKQPSASTVTVRLSALGNFFDFIRRAQIRPDNPCDDVPRPKALPPVPRGLNAAELRILLDALPDKDSGRRDRAIIVTALLTGLRRHEVLSLTRAQLDLRGDVAFYTVRVKGGAERHRELPRPALDAMRAYWQGRGVALDTMPADARIFDVTGQGFATSLKRAAKRAGLDGDIHIHALRHSSAKLRREAGASLEDVQAHLGHANIATTGRYLARLEGATDSGWAGPAAALGLS
jgi:site-specific recombinase XerD